MRSILSPTPDSAGGNGTPSSRPPQLPAPTRVLEWIYIGRLVLVATFIARATWTDLGSAPWVNWVVFIVLPIVVGFTATSYGYSRAPERKPPEWFLVAQVAADALLLTLIVYLTGNQDSIYAPFYILLICAAALLLPVQGGTFVALLAIVLYLASISWSGASLLNTAVLLQLALFVMVALVTSYLGRRLYAAGTALGEVQSELQQLRLDTDDILTSISTGIITVENDGTLAFVNPAAEELLGLRGREWVGKPVLARLDEIAPGLGEVIGRSRRDRTAVRRFETQPEVDDAFVLGVSTTLVDRADGEDPAVTAIFQNITEKKRLEALRRRAERTEAIAELSASLAHEIKNPLASIRSAVEQIASASVDPEDAHLLRNLVLRESDRLSRLLEEFIDFARVKVTAPAPVEFRSLVRHALEVVRAHPDAEGRRLKISDSAAAEELWLLGAEDLLHRAVLNLVLNATQWAGAGGQVLLIVDEVRSDLLTPEVGELSLIRLTVADSGPGVPPELVETIFDPFVTHRVGGTGLGLALVQRAVEAHGGAIFVDNAPSDGGTGAMFTLYLPSLPPELAAGAASTATQESIAS
jgi:two-component system, NtrC family, sensor histidine kinase PilS